MRSALGLAGWLVIVGFVAALGAQATPGPWYAELSKPTWNPPGWIFGPVWTTLYVMMAVAAWMVWRKGGFRARRFPLALFVLQLALNGAWSPLFFGMRNPGLALVDIVALWVCLFATTMAFFRIRALAGVLLTPYLAWVTFATALNGTIWSMNR